MTQYDSQWLKSICQNEKNKSIEMNFHKQDKVWKIQKKKTKYGHANLWQSHWIFIGL